MSGTLQTKFFLKFGGKSTSRKWIFFFAEEKSRSERKRKEVPLALCTITQQNSREALRQTRLIFQSASYLYRCRLFLRNLHCSRCSEGRLLLVLLDCSMGILWSYSRMAWVGVEKDIALLLVFLWPPGVQFSVIFQYQFLISYLSYAAALRHFNSRPVKVHLEVSLSCIY